MEGGGGVRGREVSRRSVRKTVEKKPAAGEKPEQEDSKPGTFVESDSEQDSGELATDKHHHQQQTSHSSCINFGGDGRRRERRVRERTRKGAQDNDAAHGQDSIGFMIRSRA